MRFWSKHVAAGAKVGLLVSLVVAAVPATAASHQATPGKKLSTSASASASEPVAVSRAGEPVTRLMIRYKTGVKLAGQSGATPATERHEAAMQVARSASLSGETRLQYLKSVSPSLHVATLEQPVSQADAQALMQRLRTDASVADVAIDRRVKSHAVSTDPNYVSGAQWHLQDSSVVPGGLNVNQAWASSIGSGVVVAVLDSGYRPHVDLVDNVLPGYDFVSAEHSSSAPALAGQPFWTAADGTGRDSDAQDPGDWVTQSDVDQNFCDAKTDSDWHGTHVAGIVAAPNNALGGLGVAFGARVLPVRVLGRCGGYTSDILAGARWAAGLHIDSSIPDNTRPAKILNLSLGVTGVACDSVTQSVVNEVRARDISVVASTGNSGSTSITMPANCSGVIAVTAHTREADSADYANVGPGTRISAAGGGNNTVLLPQPGNIRGIFSTWNTGTTVPVADGYAAYRGTSMATPQVAGVLALMSSLHPSIPMASLEGLLLGSARAFPAGGYCSTNLNQLPTGFCGSGLLDAHAAMTAAALATTSVADLRVAIVPSAIVAAQGQTVDFSVRLLNIGLANASNVTLTSVVSAGLEVIGASSNLGTVTQSLSGASVTVPLLEAGQIIELKLSARVLVSAGDVVVSGEGVSTVADNNLSNNATQLVMAAGTVVPPVVAPADSGGGCTAAPNGRADGGLVLIVLAAGLLMGLRRRQSL